MIFFNLTPVQRKTETIDYKVFLNILKYYNIKLEAYISVSNNRDSNHNKIQTFFELINVWSKIKKFYLKKFGDDMSSGYDSNVVGAVNLISQLSKHKDLVSKNKIWLLYLYLENMELSYIRLYNKNY